MCECGCVSGNQIFKLKAPDGWYIIEFMPGCNYCLVGSSIQIHHPESIEPMNFGFDTIEEMESVPDLPVIGEDEHCITMIKCGLDPGEARSAAVQCFTGDENGIDDIFADILGEDFWKEAFTNSPTVIERKN